MEATEATGVGCQVSVVRISLLVLVVVVLVVKIINQAPGVWGGRPALILVLVAKEATVVRL
jgi:hypothetical protein